MKFLLAPYHHEVQNFIRLLKAQKMHISVKGVHDLRVCTRRLRSLIWLLKRSLQNKDFDISTTKQALKNLGDVLGEKREWDVALENARKYNLPTRKLQTKQQAAKIHLQKTLKSPLTKALSKELLQWEKALKNKNLKITSQEIKPLRTDLNNWLHVKNLSRKKMHELRISTKKIRYALEALDLPVEKLKNLQDHLGKSHDLTVLSDCFQDSKAVKRDEKKEHKKAKKQIRPALRSSLEVLKSLR